MYYKSILAYYKRSSLSAMLEVKVAIAFLFYLISALRVVMVSSHTAKLVLFFSSLEA